MTTHPKPRMTDPCPKRGFAVIVARPDLLLPNCTKHMGNLAPQINGTAHLAHRPKHDPITFTTRAEAEQFVAERGTHGSMIMSISHSVTCGCL